MQEKNHIPETEIIAIILFNKLSPLYCTNRQNKCKNSRMGKSRLVGYACGVVASCCLLIVFGSVSLLRSSYSIPFLCVVDAAS